jgi:hypothetical protein
MPSYPNQQRLKLDILDRIAAGELLTAICADPAMPSHGAVLLWRRRDPAFATALADARRTADHIRRYAFDEGRAQAILARVRAGEKLQSILRDPDMPSRKVCTQWRATQAHFQEELSRLHDLHRKDRLQRLRDGAWAFDQAVADRIMVRVARGEPLCRVNADPAMPGRGLLNRWRRERPDYDRLMRRAVVMGWGRRGPRLRTPELTEAILDGLVLGESLASLGRRPDMPSAATLYAWVAQDEAFARQVVQACDQREDWYDDQMVMLDDAPDPATMKAWRARIAPLVRRRGQLHPRPGRKWRS